MLKEKSQRALSQDSKCSYEKKRSHAQLANVDGVFLEVQPQLTTLSSGKEGSYFVQFLKAKPII